MPQAASSPALGAVRSPQSPCIASAPARTCTAGLIEASPSATPSSTVMPATPVPTTTTPTPVAHRNPAATATSGAARQRLSWPPPALVHPIVKTLCNCNISDGQIVVSLNLGQDYILKDPVVLTHPVVIQGGHNVVWVGGHIRPASGPNVGIQLSRNAGAGGGTIHLEGLYLDGVSGVVTDGIAGGEYAGLSKPSGTLADATLQVENVRVGPLSGDSRLNHQDC